VDSPVIRCSLIVIAIGLLCGCASHPAQNDALSGLELYQRLCSSCHGADAQGDGPVASLLNVRVPDLTRLAARDGGEFPTEDARRVIDGRNERRAHGPREMPVWGWELYDVSRGNDLDERARTDSMINRLVTYLQSIQRE